MNTLIITVITACSLVLVHIMLVLILIRTIKSSSFSPTMAHMLSAITMALVLFVASICISSILFWLSFPILAFGVCAYLFFFGAVYKSLSLRFLMKVKSNGGIASFEFLDMTVTTPSFVDRANLLCKLGLVNQNKNEFKITPKGVVLVKKINSMRRLFGIRTTGLYQ